MRKIDYNINSFTFFSLVLSFFGFYLIIGSVMNIFSLEENFNNQHNVKLTPKFNTQENPFLFEDNFTNQKIKKLAPKFVMREDLSIKDLSINLILGNNNNKNSKSKDQSINLNDLEHEKIVFNNDIPIINLKILPKEFYLIKEGKTQKEKFIISILPIVVQENERIRNNRERLLKIKDFLVINKTFYIADQRFLEHLASEYNVNMHNKHKIDIIETLLELVDVIPNSIVLAQAANESGWGTSRFAKEFNALFGEYTFDIKSGVVPTYREEGEKHLIKFFSSVDESIKSYFHNLNTHMAYKDFRQKRQQLRKNKLELDPVILIKYLKHYAKDKNYVKNIQSIIKTNKLNQFDSLKIITTES